MEGTNVLQSRLLWRSEYPEEDLVLQWLARKMRRKTIAQDEENVVESSREQSSPNADEQQNDPCSPPSSVHEPPYPFSI